VSVKIYLNDGSIFVVNEPLKDVERAFQEARDVKGVLRITNGAGKTHVVNPDQVSVIEEDETLDPAPAAEAARTQ
jgi:hypothetical protein